MYRTLALLTMMTASLYAYPAQYEESLRKDYSQEYGDQMRFWFMLPEDIQRPCRITGSASVVARSGDTVEIVAACSYADTLQYRMIKVSPETNTDFDDLTVSGDNIRPRIYVDSIVYTGIDPVQYGDTNGLYLDSMMRAPEYAGFGQRLHAMVEVGPRNDTTEVWLELTKYVSMYDPDGDQQPPTIRNCRYGPHWERNVFDFWKAPTNEPAPVFMFIHGGGWGALEKCGIRSDADAWLSRGFAVVAANYRLVSTSRGDGVTPPSMYPLYDAVRMMQTVRSRAAEFNTEPNRIATNGGSAGGCSSMWLALHDDLADPSSTDPIARYSSKPTVATGVNAQTSLNPYDHVDWPYIGTTNAIFTSNMPADAYGIPRGTWQEKKAALMALPRDMLDEYSPLTHVTADDVPVYLSHTDGLVDCTPEACEGGAIHHAQHAVALKEKMDAVGVECVIDIPGESYPDPYGSVTQFIVDKLSSPTDSRAASHMTPRVSCPGITVVRAASGAMMVHVPVGSRLQVFDTAGRRIAVCTGRSRFTLPASANGVCLQT